MVVQNRRRSGVSKVAQAALQFISWRDQESEAKKNKNKERDAVSRYLVPDEDATDLKDVHAGNPNQVRVDEEKGHRYYDFSPPVTMNGRTYEALELQRRVTGPYMDLDKVETFFDPEEGSPEAAALSRREAQRRKEMYQKVYHAVTEHIWDFDVIYRLQQEGDLTKEEVEALMSTDVSWSLGVKEAR